MNKKYITLAIIFISCLDMNAQDIFGIWKFENDFIDIEIELCRKGNGIDGFHCIVYNSTNEFIDCGNPNQKTISGTFTGYNQAILDINSEYELDAKSKIRVKLISKNQLAWTLVSSRIMQPLYPQKITLERIQ